MIRVELTQADVDYAVKTAKVRRAGFESRVKRHVSTDEPTENLDVVNSLAKVAVAKFMDLKFKEVKKLNRQGMLTSEFRRDGTLVPLWIKGTRKPAGTIMHLFFPCGSRFPAAKSPLIACRIVNNYLIEFLGWIFTDDLLKLLKPTQTRYGTNWAIPVTLLEPIETFEPVFGQVLDAMKVSKQDWHIPCKRLSTPTSMDAKARLV